MMNFKNFQLLILLLSLLMNLCVSAQDEATDDTPYEAEYEEYLDADMGLSDEEAEYFQNDNPIMNYSGAGARLQWGLFAIAAISFANAFLSSVGMLFSTSKRLNALMVELKVSTIAKMLSKR